MSLYLRGGKRAVDIVLGAILLTVVLPLMVLIGFVLWVREGRPILHRETRIGREGRPFCLIKFRTMRNCAGATVAADDDPRIHRLGRHLRRSHLDELPQLWHVLRGQMSLVGPRPYKPEHFALLSLEQQHELRQFRPGMTSEAGLEFLAEDASLAAYPEPETLYLNVLLPRKAQRQIRDFKAQGMIADLRVLGRTLTVLFSSRLRMRSQVCLRQILDQESRRPHCRD